MTNRNRELVLGRCNWFVVVSGGGGGGNTKYPFNPFKA